MSEVNQDLVFAGRVAAQIHQNVARLVRPGVNLLEIEDQISAQILVSGTKPAFLGYKKYPAVSCLSVNSAVVHAIPVNYVLRDGDVLSVDLGVKKNGWIVDTAWSHAIGKIDSRKRELLSVTKKALYEAIKVARVGNHVGDIGQIVQNIIEEAGFYVIRDLTGHGVGKKLQMPPSIPNFGHKGTGPELHEGMVLAIEPITALSRVSLTLEEDNWTVRAHPDVVCAHFEHTIVVTKGSPVVLTKLSEIR
ncbi:MAG: type I methionyl aminopeptidase [Patescibacteria group bacterium]